MSRQPGKPDRKIGGRSARVHECCYYERRRPRSPHRPLEPVQWPQPGAASWGGRPCPRSESLLEESARQEVLQFAERDRWVESFALLLQSEGAPQDGQCLLR